LRWCVPSDIRTSTLNIPPQEPIGKKCEKWWYCIVL
jgi:hypothetical protein